MSNRRRGGYVLINNVVTCHFKSKLLLTSTRLLPIDNANPERWPATQTYYASTSGWTKITVSNRTKVVFVVDDDPAMRKSIALMLNHLGFVTKPYASAEAFLSASPIPNTSDSCCCIVLDIQLGGISGIELASRLAGSNQRLPTIFITGNDDETVRRAALQQGCVAYLTKPFAAKLLLEAIDRALA